MVYVINITQQNIFLQLFFDKCNNLTFQKQSESKRYLPGYSSASGSERDYWKICHDTTKS